MRLLRSISLFAGLAMLGCAGQPPDTVGQPASGTRQEFEVYYQAWQEKIKRDFSAVSSFDPYRDCDEYERLVALGPRAVPFMVEEIAALEKSRKGADQGDARRTVPTFLLREAVERIVHKKFKNDAEVVTWWRSRGEAPARFRQAYAQWRRAKADGQSALQVEETVYDDRSKTLQTRQTRTELGQAYFAIRDLGIDAMPLIIETIKAGDYDLLPIFGDVGGLRLRPEHAGPLAEQAKDALHWWEVCREECLLPPPPAPQQQKP
jgi:hypothetical protein